MSMQQEVRRDEDAESLVKLRALVLDFTDYLPHDNEEVEKLRKISDELQERFEERYGDRPQGW